ncbi:MAG: regulatory protein RecX [Phycisphaeraceae bacterium]|nr:regulatory protein RecX [Phycisphaeraceae bacterium]
MSESTGTITELKPSGRDPLLRLVKVGRRTVATLTLDQIQNLGLSVGAVWDETTAEAAERTRRTARARREALRLLGRRAYSASDLADRLGRRHDAEVAEEVIGQLRRRGLVDDAKLARNLIRQKRSRSPAGSRLLRQTLRQKGIDREVAEEALTEADQVYDAVAEARKLALKKLQSTSYQKIPAAKRRQRLWGLLGRRGFDSQQIAAALENLEGMDEDEAFSP